MPWIERPLSPAEEPSSEDLFDPHQQQPRPGMLFVGAVVLLASAGITITGVVLGVHWIWGIAFP